MVACHLEEVGMDREGVYLVAIIDCWKSPALKTGKN